MKNALLLGVFLFISLVIGASAQSHYQRPATAHEQHLVYENSYLPPHKGNSQCEMEKTVEVGISSNYTDDELGFRYYNHPDFQTDTTIEGCTNNRRTYGLNVRLFQSANGKINDGSEVDINLYVKFKIGNRNALNLQAGNWFYPQNLRITNFRTDFTHTFAFDEVDVAGKTKKKTGVELTESISFYSTNDQGVPGGVAQISELAVSREFSKFSVRVAPVLAFSNSPYYGPGNRLMAVGGVKTRFDFPVSEHVSLFAGLNVFKQLFGPSQPVGLFTPVLGISFHSK